jgi:glycosyltransferase involved in cell wall biosynthesis
VRLLAIARLARQKGIACAVAALAQSRSQAVLRIVGDGPERPALERAAVSLGVADRIEFKGWAARSELLGHYQWADQFVLPSIAEGMPTVVTEALAVGLPVVATDVFGIRDVIEPGRNGFIVPPGEPTALAHAIDALAGSPERLRLMCDHSRQMVLDHRWENVAQQYHSALLSATQSMSLQRNIYKPKSQSSRSGGRLH